MKKGLTIGLLAIAATTIVIFSVDLKDSPEESDDIEMLSDEVATHEEVLADESDESTVIVASFNIQNFGKTKILFYR